MNANDVYTILCKFIENDFKHLVADVDALRGKLNWILCSIITLLLGTIGSLVLLIIKK